MNEKRIYHRSYCALWSCGHLPSGEMSTPVFSSYAYLMTMLAQGWQIEPPVYVRLRWQSRSRSKETKKENTCHFILWHGDKVNLVSVHDCPQIQQFLADNGLAVDRL